MTIDEWLKLTPMYDITQLNLTIEETVILGRAFFILRTKEKK
jgi:hypothetical protein